MKFYDYIIASFRLRIFGAKADLAILGLPGFAPFYVQNDNAEPTDPLLEVRLAQKLSYAADDFRLLTTFDYDEGRAKCLFYASDVEFLFVMEGEDGYSQHYLCERSCKRVFSDVVIEPHTVACSMFRFGLWFMLGIAMAKEGFSAVHSSTIVVDGRAVMFLGESGTGKSTHTRLWRENIAGATLLNDDSPFIGLKDDQVMVYGSPWSGKTPCYKNQNYPLHAIVRLSQAPYNKITRQRSIFAIGALLPSLPPALLHDRELESLLHDILSAVISRVPLYHLECLPDADAAFTSYNALYGKE